MKEKTSLVKNAGLAQLARASDLHSAVQIRYPVPEARFVVRPISSANNSVSTLDRNQNGVTPRGFVQPVRTADFDSANVRSNRAPSAIYGPVCIVAIAPDCKSGT